MNNTYNTDNTDNTNSANNDLENTFQQGLDAYQEKRYDDAKKYLNKSIENGHKLQQCYNMLLHIEIYLGNKNEQELQRLAKLSTQMQ